MLYDVFQKLQLNLDGVQGFNGSQAWLSGEWIQIISYVTLKTTYGVGVDVKTISVDYFIMDAMLLYIIILFLGHSAINAFGAVVRLWSGRIHLIFNLEISAPRWHSGNHPRWSTSGSRVLFGQPRTSRAELTLIDDHPFEVPNTHFEGLDHRLGTEAERITPIEGPKEVQSLEQNSNLSRLLTRLPLPQQLQQLSVIVFHRLGIDIGHMYRITIKNKLVVDKFNYCGSLIKFKDGTYIWKDVSNILIK